MMELQKAEDKSLLIRIKDNSIATKPFKEALQKICYSIGIREALDSADLDSIFNFISRNYGLLNLKEITEAFELYSADKLKFADHKFGHYGQFDLTFIGKVLNAYGVWKINEVKKPKIANQEEKYVWQMHEKEKHFFWLRDDVFLETSERNGKRGEFPGIVIASFKDIYEYMLDQRMTIEPMGDTLKQRISACNARARVEKSDSDSFVRVVNKSDGIKTAAYYKYQVMDYFRENIK